MPDLRKLPLGRLCNFIYWYLTRDGSSEDVDKFRAKLWQPPKGVEADRRSPWSAEAEAQSFSSARMALGLSPTGTKKQDA